ncbi:hypothetical protein EDB83DRAFT_2318208 [Lactarius deliciosus]|nr:hypothetical protein EDB83DRAFT_2318208 [Lactarius deliciosus]
MLLSHRPKHTDIVLLKELLRHLGHKRNRASWRGGGGPCKWRWGCCRESARPKLSLSSSAGVLHVATAWCQGGGGGGVAWRGDGGGELEAKAKDDGGGYGVDVWRSGGSDVALRQ